MVRGTLERVLGGEQLDEWYARTAEKQYTRPLLFSTVYDLLSQVVSVVSPGRHAVVVVDGAGWHGPDVVQGLENLTLLKLPPASPELNPAEQLWQPLRQRYLANRSFSGYQDIVQRTQTPVEPRPRDCPQQPSPKQ